MIREAYDLNCDASTMFYYFANNVFNYTIRKTPRVEEKFEEYVGYAGKSFFLTNFFLPIFLSNFVNNFAVKLFNFTSRVSVKIRKFTTFHGLLQITVRTRI